LIDVDDVLQEAFIQAIRDIHTCQASTTEGFAAWLTMIAQHRLQDMLKRQKRRKRGGDRRQNHVEQDGASSWLGLIDLVAGPVHTPSQSVARREAVRAIQVAVAALPDDQREAVRRRYLDGKSIDETAAEMDRTPAAVNGLVRRAKQALRESLKASSEWLMK
jgi:RNA polymerase sigma-70 factor (ECF subfamily)